MTAILFKAFNVTPLSSATPSLQGQIQNCVSILEGKILILGAQNADFVFDIILTAPLNWRLQGIFAHFLKNGK